MDAGPLTNRAAEAPSRVPAIEWKSRASCAVVAAETAAGGAEANVADSLISRIIPE